MNWVWKLRVLYRLISVGKRPEDYSRIEKLREGLSQVGLVHKAAGKVITDEQCIETLAQQFARDKSTLEEIFHGSSRLDSDTLGHHVQLYFQKTRVPIEYYSHQRTLATSTETLYVNRILYSHDYWHVLLDIATDPLSEMKLQAFLFRQTHWPTAPLLIAGFLLKTFLRSPSKVYESFQEICQGWELGCQFESLFFVPWSDLVNRNLDELKSELKRKG